MKKRAQTALVVDDHPIMRRGVVDLLSMIPDVTVVGEAATRGEALAIAQQQQPDLAIVDVSLDGMHGLDLVKQLVLFRSDIGILVYSMHDETIYAERALRAGARGYLMKQAPPEAFLDAVMRVAAGQVALSPAMADRMMTHVVGAGRGEPRSAVHHLSDRELEVLELLGNGFGTSEIAEKLNLSVKTVETYREHLKRKLVLPNATALVRFATSWVLDPASAAARVPGGAS
ncbi:MAG: response regulator transcription factor [Gemmatimonadaceae bacterium]|jgi:DNA-binding NarL/FixJ family response regulator|nr:response regulator transcription factor [Gemmatimonadaceae bacterium]